MTAQWGKPSFEEEQVPLLPPGKKPQLKPWKVQFPVQLHRKQGDKLGFGANLKSESLEIIQVKGGLLTQWNAAHPDRVVKVGDIITEINGVKEDAQAMDALLRTNPQTVNMLVSRRKASRNGWRIVTGWIKASFGSALLFAAVSLLFMFCFHVCPRLMMVLGLLLLAACVGKAAHKYHYAKRRSIYKKTVLFWLVFSLASTCGAVVGTSIYLNELKDYWSFYSKRHYTNVAPDEPAAAHDDASAIVFMEGSKPDPSRFAAYWRYDAFYCVAPVAVDTADTNGEDPTVASAEYWAVGKDCCGKNGFSCYDAADPLARSGLVLQRGKPEDVIMPGIISNNDMAYYEEAVKMSLARFGITSSKERLYVRFVKDLEAAHRTMWNGAWTSWWKMQFLFFVVWMVTGAMAVLIGIGGQEDSSRYAEHMADLKSNVLEGVNSYI